MNKNIIKLAAVLFAVITMAVIFTPVSTYAADEAATESVENQGAKEGKAMPAAICVGLAAAAGAIGMAIAISKSNESIARQPEAEGAIRTGMMLGLVFIETAIIYALIVAILIIFVL